MTIRPAVRGDAELLFGLIRELAEYEKLGDAVRGDAELLARTLFDQEAAEPLIAEVDGEAVGYAIFFDTFSTFECRSGIWVEDLFVRPEHRRRGIGRSLLARIAATALERGCARLEWSALDWNEPALRFYDELGATRLGEWLTLRLDGQELERLGAEPSKKSQ
ncbi:MAG TPA: GNAT family N-acetyltransferase [Solirubrobacterales bacterium]|nr:GNAT family N-acetyltransferase [Solirubrobacterales bacterium]